MTTRKCSQKGSKGNNISKPVPLTDNRTQTYSVRDGFKKIRNTGRAVKVKGRSIEEPIDQPKGKQREGNHYDEDDLHTKNGSKRIDIERSISELKVNSANEQSNIRKELFDKTESLRNDFSTALNSKTESSTFIGVMAIFAAFFIGIIAVIVYLVTAKDSQSEQLNDMTIHIEKVDVKIDTMNNSLRKELTDLRKREVENKAKKSK